LVIFDIGGNILIYKFLIEVNRADVKRKILSPEPDENFETIVMKKETFDKYFNQSETDDIEYKGVMYDIKEISFNGDSVYLYCYKDVKETAIKKNVLNKENSARNHRQKNIRNYRLLCISITLPENKMSFSEIQIFFNSITSDSYCQNFITPPSPPPKMYV
jgi:hypothetical protein